MNAPILAAPSTSRRGRDVHEHQCGGVDVALADGDQAGAAAHRRPDEHRAVAAELVEHGDEVLDLGVLAVVAVGRPVGVAVAPGVEGDGAVAGAGERLAGALPRVAGLAAAVLQHDERRRRDRPTRRRRCAAGRAVAHSCIGSGVAGRRVPALMSCSLVVTAPGSPTAAPDGDPGDRHGMLRRADAAGASQATGAAMS